MILLNPGDKGRVRTAMESREFRVLTGLGKAPANAMHYWRLYFQGCATCDTTQTLGIEDVVLTRDKKGNLERKATKVVHQLRLMPEDTVAVAMSLAPLTPAAKER